MARRLILCLTTLATAAVGGYVLFSYVPTFTSPSGTPPSSPPRDESESTLTLDEDERAYVWDIEHHGNVLTKYGFKLLAAAVVADDPAALDRMLAPEFTASKPTMPREASLHTEVLDVVRSQDNGGPTTTLDRKGFVAELLDWRHRCRGAVEAKLALMALSPVTRGAMQGPWQGTAQLRLWGQRDQGKPAEVIAYLRYQTCEPTKERLKQGAWLSSCAITQVQIGAAERFLFREVAAERGIDRREFHDNWDFKKPRMNGGGVFACDFNRDGVIDLLITDINRVALYQGLPGGKFIDVTSQKGLPVHPSVNELGNLRARFVDLDGDGWEDLILGTIIFRNDRGERFVRLGAECNLILPSDYTALAVADFDGDGLLDLYAARPGTPKTGSWLTGTTGDRHGNILFRNKGNWQFEDVTRSAGVEGGHRSSFTAVWLDADNDGKPDLYVINEFGDGVLYRNRGRGPSGGPVTFEPRSLAPPPCDFGAMGVVAGDIDNDGNIDIYSGNMYSKAGKRVIGNLKPGAYPDAILERMRTFVTGSQLHHNLGNLQFEQLGQAWQVNDCGWAYGPALADLDNDGFLDLFATCGFVSRTRDEPDG
jgi:hypothetical protein